MTTRLVTIAAPKHKPQIPTGFSNGVMLPSKRRGRQTHPSRQSCTPCAVIPITSTVPCVAWIQGYVSVQDFTLEEDDLRRSRLGLDGHPIRERQLS